jgi:5-methylcytosine-specific restriction protein A
VTRREFSVAVRKAAWERCQGKCESCGTPFMGRRPDYDHVKPDGLDGEPTLGNCQVLCRICHEYKTHQQDRPVMAKADRQGKAEAGIKAIRGPPMPGTKRSGLRKRMNGNVERRVGENGDKA